MRTVLTITLCFVAGSVFAQPKKTPTKKLTYDDNVKPLLRQKCASCHNPDKKLGGLDVTSYTAIMQGGSSGEVIERGDAESSYLYMLVSHESQPFMPPKSEKLAKPILDTFRNWIDAGALENSGSKFTPKPKNDLALAGASNTRPKGPPPMPGPLSLEPVTKTTKTTAVTALATSPWAQLAAIAGQKQILLYDTKTLKLRGVLPFAEGIANVLKFSRNGSLLLAGGGKGALLGKVVIFSVKTGERIAVIGDELDEILAADISSDQQLVALGGPQKMVRVYSTKTGKKLWETKKHTDWIYSLEFSPDSVLLATGDRANGLLVWEARTGREYLNLTGHRGAINSVSFRHDSNTLASGSADGSVKIWEVENGTQVRSFGAHGGGVECVEYTRDGRIVTAGRDRTVKIFNGEGRALRTFPAFKDLALEATHCDESNRVIGGDWTGEIRIWDAKDGKQLGHLRSNPPSISARIPALEKQLAAMKASIAPKKSASDSAAAALKKLQSDIAGMKKTAGNIAAMIKAKQAEAAALPKTIPALKKQLADLNTQIATKSATAKLLAEAIAKLTEAGKKDAGTAKALAAQMAMVKAEHKKLTTAITQLTAKQKPLTAQVAAGEAKLKTLPGEIQKLLATQKTLPATLKATEARLKPTTTAAAKAKADYDAVAGSLKKVESEIASWKNAASFAKELASYQQLKTRHNEAIGKRMEAEAALKRIDSQIAAANKTIAEGTKTSQAMSKQIQTATEAAKKADGLAAALAKGIKPLEALSGRLNDIARTSADTLKASPNDADLKALAAAAQKAAKAKATQLATARLDVTKALAMAKMHRDKAAQLAESAKAKRAAYDAARKKLPELTTKRSAAAKAVTTAKSAEQAAATQLNAVKKKMDALASTK